MLALKLAEEWYWEFGRPMLTEKFPDDISRIAVGFAGHGSESFGFDDELSQDHDFGIGFSLWITEKDEERIGFRLMRAYNDLKKIHPPKDFHAEESLFGESDFGVCTIEDYYRRHIGLSRAPETWQEWLGIPDYAIAEATNGIVFSDELGEFTRIRNILLNEMPEDVRLKKLAAHLVMAAQAGQYNYRRCMKHGESGAARLALGEFAMHALQAVYLLNKRFAPYYKWIFRAAKDLPKLSESAELITMVLTTQLGEDKTAETIELICAGIAGELHAQGLTDIDEIFLEPQAFEVTERIRNQEIRSLHIMDGI